MLMDRHDQYVKILNHTNCIYTNFHLAAHANAIILLRASDNYARGSIMGSAPHIHWALNGWVLMATDRIMKLFMRGACILWVLTHPDLVSYIFNDFK